MQEKKRLWRLWHNTDSSLLMFPGLGLQFYRNWRQGEIQHMRTSEGSFGGMSQRVYPFGEMQKEVLLHESK